MDAPTNQITLSKKTITVPELQTLRNVPQLCRAKRLLYLAQQHGSQNAEMISTQVLALKPQCALAQAACVPALLGRAVIQDKGQNSKDFFPFALSRRTQIPLYVLHDGAMDDPWFREFDSYLDVGDKDKTLHKIDHPFDIPALSVTKESAGLHTLLGTSDSVALWGAVGLLGLRCTVNEMDRLLDGESLSLKCPRVIRVELTGSLPAFASALDISYYIINQFACLYEPHKIVEFYGSALDQISLEMRQEICLQCRWMDAEAVIWPVDRETLRAVSHKNDFKALAQGFGLWHDDTDVDRDYDETLHINLGSVKPGYALRLTSPAPMHDEATQSWAPPYTPPTDTFPSAVLPVTRAVVVLGAHSKSSPESMFSLAIFLEKAVSKKLSFKVPMTFFIHKDHLASSDMISQMCEHILTLNGSFELQNLPFSTHVTTSDGTTLLTSSHFACVFALTGTTHIENLPDLSPAVTLKDIWPSTEDIQERTAHTPLSRPEKVKMTRTHHRPFWAPNPRCHEIPSDIENARPLPILRNHNLTFSLLSRGPIAEREDEPFEAYRGNLDYLKMETQKVIKRHIPKICESYLDDDTPLVIFGGHCYGRGGDWTWFERALALVHVKAVVAYSFDPIIHRALLGSGIVPLHWIAPLSADTIFLDGRESIDITGINTAFTTNHVVTMSVSKDNNTFLFPLMLRDPLYPHSIDKVA